MDFSFCDWFGSCWLVGCDLLDSAVATEFVHAGSIYSHHFDGRFHGRPLLASNQLCEAMAHQHGPQLSISGSGWEELGVARLCGGWGVDSVHHASQPGGADKQLLGIAGG